MTSNQQRAALQRQIWQIANDVRGAVDGWDFKQYVLGTLFYRFISENFASYIEADDDSITYAGLSDDIITPDIKDDAVKTKGYFIYPSQLFANIAKGANTNESLNTDLAAIFAAIESSANGYPSERDIKGLFADFDTTSNRLGNTVTDKNTRLAAVLKGVAGLDFGDFQGNHIDLFGDEKPFDAIVSNPPYSVKWIGADDPTLINDDRFAPAGVLAPKSKADFAFVLHALSYLSSKGRAAIVCFPGIFYRGGAEKKIRQYLVDNNYVETVISLAPNLFFGTTIAVNILVLSKHKTDTSTQFIDAGGLFKKETNNNVLTDKHIEQIMQVFDSKEQVDHFAQSLDNDRIAANDYNLSVSSYVEAKDNREVIDIAKLNVELKTTVAKIDRLRSDIDTIVTEIES
jgi:type I restriction-modification system DNA methylase subunit